MLDSVSTSVSDFATKVSDVDMVSIYAIVQPFRTGAACYICVLVLCLEMSWYVLSINLIFVGKY